MAYNVSNIKVKTNSLTMAASDIVALSDVGRRVENRARVENCGIWP